VTDTGQPELRESIRPAKRKYGNEKFDFISDFSLSFCFENYHKEIGTWKKTKRRAGERKILTVQEVIASGSYRKVYGRRGGLHPAAYGADHNIQFQQRRRFEPQPLELSSM
jgi:hypothetical protein